MSTRWRSEGGQHQGDRPYQEDAWTLKPLANGSVLAVVADGMGGHAGGAVASKLVVEAFASAFEHRHSLAEGLQQANEAVRKGALARPELAGMGSTVVAALLEADELSWISVGDSPLYLVSASKLERLNADHSMSPHIDELQARGVLTAEEAASHPGRHTLREAVMGRPLELVDKGSRHLASDARLLLCSDGVHSLADAEIARRADRPVNELIAAVRGVGSQHQDNITIVKLERQS